MTDLSSLPLPLLEATLARLEQHRSKQLLYSLFPDEGPLRRELYPQQMAFFALGKDKTFRALMAANRVGKTVGGGYEVTLHLTGEYPAWWQGRRFDRPTRFWAAGDTKETVRDIVQAKMMGMEGHHGTGLIPDKLIGKVRMRPNGNGAVDTIEVKHVPTGRWSVLGFKSYDQGRTSFQGTERDGIWLDEEPPEDVREECVLRLMTTGGILIETYTPLKGVTPVVMKYMPGGYDGKRLVIGDDKALVMAGWEDVPHLGDAEKRIMLAEAAPHTRDARSKGIPSLGSGSIYPVPESEFVVDDFELPVKWPRAYGMDVGWNRTAVIWGARDPQSDILYLYSEHYRGQAEPAIHAQAVRARGQWIRGAIDPAARGRGQRDGDQLFKSYEDLGLHLTKADNSVETGILDVWQRLSSGRLKVFRSCMNWLMEFRMYARDEKGRIKDGQQDHLMDASRYLVRSGLKVETIDPAYDQTPSWQREYYGGGRGFMAA